MALLHVDFFSNVLGMAMNMEVILPQKTEGQIGISEEEQEGRLKTVYLLHGMSDDQSVWQRYTSIERYAKARGISVVMPTTHLGWYTDTTFGMKYFTFVSEELPKICHQFFPQISNRPQDTLAAGNSMGGYGAWKLALGTEGIFGAAASLSGVLDINSRLGDIKDQEAYWNGIFGTQKERQEVNDLFYLMEQKKKSGTAMPKLYSWCGTQDQFYEHNLSVWRRMYQLGVSVQSCDSEGGHDWESWDIQIQRAVDWWLSQETGE